MTDRSQVQIRRLLPADARLFREIRLEALQQAPEAFGSTFEQECSQSLDAVRRGFGEGGCIRGIPRNRSSRHGRLPHAGRSKRAHKGFLWGMYVRSSARGTGVANLSSKPFSLMRANALNWFN